MTTYVLVLIFNYAVTTIDFNSRSLCEQAGYEIFSTIPQSNYFCIERQ